MASCFIGYPPPSLFTKLVFLVITRAQWKQSDNALALYGQSFKEWGYRAENVSLALYGMSFKELGFQMENVNTMFYSRNIVRLVKEKEDPVLEEEEKHGSDPPL